MLCQPRPGRTHAHPATHIGASQNSMCKQLSCPSHLLADDSISGYCCYMYSACIASQAEVCAHLRSVCHVHDRTHHDQQAMKQHAAHPQICKFSVALRSGGVQQVGDAVGALHPAYPYTERDGRRDAKLSRRKVVAPPVVCPAGLVASDWRSSEGNCNRQQYRQQQIGELHRHSRINRQLLISAAGIAQIHRWCCLSIIIDLRMHLLGSET